MKKYNVEGYLNFFRPSDFFRPFLRHFPEHHVWQLISQERLEASNFPGRRLNVSQRSANYRKTWTTVRRVVGQKVLGQWPRLRNLVRGAHPLSFGPNCAGPGCAILPLVGAAPRPVRKFQKIWPPPPPNLGVNPGQPQFEKKANSWSFCKKNFRPFSIQRCHHFQCCSDLK